MPHVGADRHVIFFGKYERTGSIPEVAGDNDAHLACWGLYRMQKVHTESVKRLCYSPWT